MTHEELRIRVSEIDRIANRLYEAFANKKDDTKFVIATIIVAQLDEYIEEFHNNNIERMLEEKEIEND
jgi:hypothetical protein